MLPTSKPFVVVWLIFSFSFESFLYRSVSNFLCCLFTCCPVFGFFVLIYFFICFLMPGVNLTDRVHAFHVSFFCKMTSYLATLILRHSHSIKHTIVTGSFCKLSRFNSVTLSKYTGHLLELNNFPSYEINI